jgi:hypothetical protein
VVLWPVAATPATAGGIVSEDRPEPITGSGGITIRRPILRGEGEVSLSPKNLLDLAQDFINDGRFDIAIILTQIASEVFTAQLMDKIFHEFGWSKNIKDILGDRPTNYVLYGNRALMSLYDNITGDIIKQTNFWPKVTRGYKIRNDVVHRGVQTNKKESEQFISGVREMQLYMNSKHDFIKVRENYSIE